MNTYPLPLRSVEHTQALLDHARKNQAVHGHAWFKAKNLNGAATVSVFGSIGLFSKEEDAISEFTSKIGSAENVDLIIDSVGGSFRVGLALHDFLKQKRTRVTIIKRCASTAVLLAIVGKPIRICSDAVIAVHPARLTVHGGAQEMRKAAELLEKIDSQFKDILRTKVAGAPLGQPGILDRCMSQTTMFTALEAVSVGLADEVIEPI